MAVHKTVGAGFAQAAAAFARGDLATTESLCLGLISSDPEAAEPWSLLAETALRRGRPDAAVVCAGKAVTLGPHDPIARLMQAKCLLALHRIRDAHGAVEAGVKLAEGNAAALEGLGAVFSMLGQHARALDLFHAAARIKPNNPQLLYNLAVAERMLGLLDEAERHCDQAIRRDPHFYLAYSLRSDLRRQTPGRNHIAELERTIEQTSQAESLMLLRFALGKERDDLGDHAEAFRHFAAGAALRRQGDPYMVAGDIAAIDRIIAANPSTAPSRGFDGDDPIFIVGLPRSGTTLVERIVATHSRIRSAGELGAFPAEMQRLAGEPDPAALGRAYSGAARQFDGLVSGRFVDKFPDNYLHCGAIHAALPKARIIALRRHPADSCFALYRTHFNGRYGFSYDLEDLADYYAAFDLLMNHWKAILPPEAFLEVAYEDLVTDTESQSRSILTFLDLPWEDGVLRFHESRAASTTASAVQVRQPVYRSSVGKWRNYATELQPLIDRLNLNLADPID